MNCHSQGKLEDLFSISLLRILIQQKKDEIYLSSIIRIPIHRPTQKGISLAPVLEELGFWCDSNMREFHPTIMEGDQMDLLKNNKEAFVKELQKKYYEKTGFYNIATV